MTAEQGQAPVVTAAALRQLADQVVMSEVPGNEGQFREHVRNLIAGVHSFNQAMLFQEAATGLDEQALEALWRATPSEQEGDYDLDEHVVSFGRRVMESCLHAGKGYAKVLADERRATLAMKDRKNEAFHERNKVVAALAKLFPSGLARTDIEGWSEDSHQCVYIDLPTGQVSWHYVDNQSYLFEGLPAYPGQWDGHDTALKYRRLAALPSSEWNNVEESLPEPLDGRQFSEEVLVVNMNSAQPYVSSSQLHFYPTENVWRGTHVTHWRRMPNLPMKRPATAQ